MFAGICLVCTAGEEKEEEEKEEDIPFLFRDVTRKWDQTTNA